MYARAEIAVNNLSLLKTPTLKNFSVRRLFLYPRLIAYRSVPRPNGPELSCGGEQPVPCSSLRGRIRLMLLACRLPRGEIVDGYFRQLE